MTWLSNRWKWNCSVFGLSVALFPTQGAFAAPQSVSKPASSSPIPQDDRTLVRIEQLIRSKDYQQAQDRLDASMRGNPSPAANYLRVGKLYFDQDEWARAGQCFEKSVAAQDNDEAHLLLGLVSRELGQPERAEKEFVKASNLNRASDVNAYFAGQQFLLDMQFEAALTYLYEAVKLNPRNASAYRALGMTQIHLGNYGLAESHYRRAIELLGNSSAPDPGPLLDLAFILLLGHDPAKIEEAWKLAKRTAQIEPDSADARYLVGKALMKMGRVRESLPELEQAEKCNPQDSKPHFQLALAYEALGEKEKAQAERQALAKTKQRLDQQGMASGSVMPQRGP